MKIIFTAAIGIFFMTAFSYFYSWLRKKPFREPALLNELLSRLNHLPKKNRQTHPVGWIIHFFVGVLFVLFYNYFFSSTGLEPTLLIYAGMGLGSGVIGIIGWKITFRIHPCPPAIHFSEYYIHLLIAHIIFGFGVWLGYYMMDCL